MDLDRMELTGAAVLVVRDVRSFNVMGTASYDFTASGTLLYQTGADGGSHRAMAWLDMSGKLDPLAIPGGSYIGARISPDGRRIAFVKYTNAQPEMWLYDWARDVQTRLTFGSPYDANPVWTPDGRDLLFSSARHGGVASLYRMRVDGGGEAVQLTRSEQVEFVSSVSPDGKAVAFDTISPGTGADIGVLALDPKTGGAAGPAKPEMLVRTAADEGNAVFSPDGRWIAYVSNETGPREIHVKRFPAAPGKWQVSAGGGFSPRWSGKSRELFFLSKEGLMPAGYEERDGGFSSGKPKLLVARKDIADFDVNPDGRRFLVMLNDDSAQRQTVRINVLLNFFDELRRRVPGR
jgi:dipeptidyl aminopeptidase/acylaminoacyl peptidase